MGGKTIGKLLPKPHGLLALEEENQPDDHLLPIDATKLSISQEIWEIKLNLYQKAVW